MRGITVARNGCFRYFNNARGKAVVVSGLTRGLVRREE
jgi:hypothetical protein